MSPSLFNMLGARPLIGRAFLAQEAQPGRNHEVVLSYGLWRRVFGGNPNVVGSTIDIDGVPTSVVGVMPAGFAYPEETEIWGPLAFSSDDLNEASRGGHAYEVLGRIKPGLSLAQVQSDMDRVGKTMIEQHKSFPYEIYGFGIILHPLLRSRRSRTGDPGQEIQDKRSNPGPQRAVITSSVLDLLSQNLCRLSKAR